MMLNFADSGHPVFRATSVLERGELRSNGKGKKSIHFNGSNETVELILRTTISVNQLSIYGALADLCKELAKDSPSTIKHAEYENLESMVVSTEFLIANSFSQTDAEVLRKLLREYEHKFEELPEHQKLTKLCSDAGLLKDIGKGQIFITLEEEGPDDMKTLCRECTLLRDQETSRARGWIRGNTKIGPVLGVKVYFHEGRYCVDIMIESLFRDRTVSWVRIVNGINSYVTETSEEILVESIELVRTGKLVAKAKTRPKLTLTLSRVSILFRQRKLIDINPGTYSQGCFEVSNFMIRLLRHDDTVHREYDGAVRFDDLAEKFKAKFDGGRLALG